MKQLKLFFNNIMCIFIGSSACNFVKATSEELYPTALMKHETQWLMKVLEQAHFNKVSVDDLNTTSFINRFVSKLDKQKLYFTQKEIKDFQLKYSSTINATLDRVTYCLDLKFTTHTKIRQFPGCHGYLMN